MEVITTKKALQEKRHNKKNKTIGFVPTMGFLHEGHLSLVNQAKKENDLVVMSIFVNPLQFGPNEDFERYPRDEEQDTRTAKEVGVDILFIPSVQEMYPNDQAIHISITKGTDVLCGKSRPGHFEGVAMVLSKLFHLIAPTHAYFGLKDAQQFAIVHTLVQHLDFQITLVGLPTVREADGLAKSSRNVYLSKTEREEATSLLKSLQVGQQYVQNGEKLPSVIQEAVTQYLQTTTNGRIEYVSVLNYPELANISSTNEQIIIAIAVQFEKARLIDNLILDSYGKQIERI